jgi:hypothetical protein
MDLFNLILPHLTNTTSNQTILSKIILGSDFEKVANDIIESIKYRKQENKKQQNKSKMEKKTPVSVDTKNGSRK